MKTLLLKKTFITASILVALGHAAIVQAYPNATTVIDAAGTNANATDLGQINCDAASDRLYVMVQDQSAPVPGLLLSVHIYSGIQMTTGTDPVSGDANPSPIISLIGGAGPYFISITKTNVGARLFTVTYQCANANTLTNTGITALQLQ